MADQPTALRLADDLQEQAVWESLYGPSHLRDLLPEAAAELRRLHAVNQELLEALKPLVHDADVLGWDTQQAHATIAKAEQSHRQAPAD